MPFPGHLVSPQSAQKPYLIEDHFNGGRPLWIDTLHYIKDEFTGYWSYRPTSQHSTKGALTVIWKFLYENPDSTRIETIKALSARGMNKGTVSTEFYRIQTRG